MDASLILRFVLISMGIVFLILSAAGAILEMARGTGKVAPMGAVPPNPLEGITKLLEALKALWDSFKAAPMWLALAGVGVLLILLGALLPLPNWTI
jgi:hypothetical protein